MPTYNFSDGDVTLTGVGSLDEIIFNDDTGIFDHRNFSFLKSGNNLLIYPDNGYVITITDHFLNTTNRIETLTTGTGSIELSASSVKTATYDTEGVGGTSGNDLILGSSGHNYEYGGIQGLAGDDIIYGGSGFDTIYAGSGNDTIYGGAGDDYIRGGENDDVIYGGAGDDGIDGDEGSNTIYGEDGNDSIAVGVSGGIAYGGNGNDIISGGAGNDIIYGDDGDDEISGGNGNGTGSDFLYGGTGNDTIFRNKGYDSVWTSGTTYINAGDGNDHIYMTYGHTGTVHGGNGNDYISTVNTLNAYVYDIAGDDYYKVGNTPGSISICQVLDTYGNDTIEIAPYSAATTYTKSGKDLIITTKDIYNVTHPYTITNFFTPVSLIENIKIYTAPAFSVIETLTTTNDTYTATSSTSPLGLDHNIINGLAGNDNIYAGIGDDIVYGGDGADKLYGQDGEDYLFGDAGNDRLYGGQGNDILDGGAGVDVADFESAVTAMYVDLQLGVAAGDGDDTLINIENVAGSSHNDTILGNSVANTIGGKNGNDTIKGGSGNDVLYGDAGNDLIYGEQGADVLYGGAGQDTFFLEAASAFNNVDIIKDFTNGTAGDFIDISDVLSSYGYDAMTDILSDWVITTTVSGNTFLEIDRDGLGTNFESESILRIDYKTLTLSDLTQDGNLIT